MHGKVASQSVGAGHHRSLVIIVSRSLWRPQTPRDLALRGKNNPDPRPQPFAADGSHAAIHRERSERRQSECLANVHLQFNSQQRPRNSRRIARRLCLRRHLECTVLQRVYPGSLRRSSGRGLGPRLDQPAYLCLRASTRRQHSDQRSPARDNSACGLPHPDRSSRRLPTVFHAHQFLPFAEPARDLASQRL